MHVACHFLLLSYHCLHLRLLRPLRPSCTRLHVAADPATVTHKTHGVPCSSVSEHLFTIGKTPRKTSEHRYDLNPLCCPWFLMAVHLKWDGMCRGGGRWWRCWRRGGAWNRLCLCVEQKATSTGRIWSGPHKLWSRPHKLSSRPHKLWSETTKTLVWTAQTLL